MKTDESGISVNEAVALLNCDDQECLEEYFRQASQLREKHFGKQVTACSIINARCGGCGEDCAFCAQSKSSTAKIKLYPLVSAEEIFNAAAHAEKNQAAHFGIVTSGRAVNPGRDLEEICKAVSMIRKNLTIKPCASLGVLKEPALLRLKEAGLARYHHNLETAGSFFNTICSTRNYDDQINTVKTARKVGLPVCAGGLFGLGEIKEQRIEMLSILRELEVDSVPLNFLCPIPGTRLENQDDLTPVECLKIIAAARLMMPDRHIRVCGGREINLREHQGQIFHAGADALMVGGYLVTKGREVKEDLKMISDAGLEIR